MPQIIDYARMAGAAYVTTRRPQNQLTGPWATLDGDLGARNSESTGFEAVAFISPDGSNIVISFAGTYDGDVFPGGTADKIADAMLFAGVPTAQLLQAARYYEDVKAQYPGVDISFTGHSLGGGLAALMAVFFNKAAVAFDQAPFRESADAESALAIQASLLAAGIIDPDLDAFILSSGAILGLRESLVTNVAVRDEFLSSDPNLGLSGPFNYLRLGLPTTYIEHGWGAASLSERAGDLHSMALLTALEANPALGALSTKIPNLLQAFFDPTSPFVSSTDQIKENLLEHLLRHQFGMPGSIAPDGMLDGLVQELGRLTQGGPAQALNEALALVLLEGYSKIDGAYDPARPVLKPVQGGMYFDVADVGSSLSGLKAYGKLAQGIRERYWTGAPGALLRLADSQRVYVQSGSAALSVMGTDLDEAMVGGVADDVLAGGAGKDILIGDGGNDRLAGGSGDDTLVGGAGLDRYEFATGDGKDRIVDSDGAGEIWFDGAPLTGGKSIDAQRWQSDDGRFVFTLVEAGLGQQDLIITTAAGDERVVVLGFQSGQLGITLATEARPVDAQPVDDVIVGDGDGNLLYDTSANDRMEGRDGDDELRLAGGGRDTVLGGNGGDLVWNDDAQDAGGDNLQGNAGSDVIVSGGAPDRLFGQDEVDPDIALALGESLPATGARGDWLDGQRGDDLVVGEAGDDALWGGDGGDVLIAGAGDDNIGGDLGTGQVLRSWVPHRVVTERSDATGSYTEYALTFTDALVSTAGGAGGVDLIWAGAGNDWIFAGAADDFVDAGSGDDVLFGETGNDQLDGGAGNDVVIGDDRSLPGDQHGDDLLFGGDGNDRLFGGGGADYLVGGAGADQLSGDDPNLALQYQGRDYLDGGGGDDLLSGGGGDDSLLGGSGRDVLAGEAGNDTLLGDDGDDELQGGDDDDVLFGGSGDDRIFGGAGLDAAYGEDGDDTIVGDAGADALFGGGGADQLIGGDDDDTLYGDAGADALYGDAGDDLLDGGEGDDQLAGGDGGDLIYAGAGDDLVAGASGIDTIYGEAGTDQLFGGDDDDFIHGGDDADEIYGNAGNDLVAGDAGDDQVHGGDGNDTVLAGQGSDLLYGEAGDDTLYGGSGAGELHGGDGGDVALGGAGDERLFGEAGADRLSGGAGSDELQGGAGDDVYQYNLGDGVDRIFESADSHGDRIIFGTGIDAAGTRLAQQGSALVFLPGPGFADQLAVANWFVDPSLRVSGVQFADAAAWDSAYLADASAAVHLFLGGSGDDTVFGTYGDDTLYGFAGNDVLSGGPGHDVLVGGAGNDVFVTGPGATSVQLSPGDGDDVLQNPGHGQVTLQFGEGVTASSLVYERVDDDLKIGWDEVITVEDWFAGNTVSLQFADGSVAPGNALIAAAAQDISTDYAFDRGAGSVQLQDWGGVDAVTFGAGIAPADVSGAREGLDLVLTVANPAGAADRLVVSGWFDGANRQIEQFRFTDSATVLTNDALTAPWLDPTGTPGADDLVSGAGYVETLRGLAGDDTLTARGGGDTLIGGAGNDRLRGSDQQETFLFAQGDGSDVVQASAGFDTLQFDRPWNQIAVARDGADLVYTFSGSADSVRVQGYGSDTARYSLRALGTVRGTEAADNLSGDAQLGDAIYGSGGNDVLSGQGGLDDLYGGAGDDVLDGGFGFDRLYGGDGNDVLGGGYASDDYLSTYFDGGEGNYYDGGAGADLYRGNRGRDAFFVGPGNGADTINQAPQLMDGGYYVSHGGDRLIFAEGITPGQLAVTRSGQDLVIGIDAQDRVTVQGWFGGASTFYRIDSFDFIVNGQQQTVWSASDVTRMALTVRGTDASDTLTGTGDDDALYGLGGDDTLSGLAGNDVLAGGAGSDRLLGGSGNDAYVFGHGDGRDVIDEQGSGSSGDSVRFGADLTSADVGISREGNDLVLTLAGRADAVVVAGALAQGASQVEEFVFADGSRLPTIEEMVHQLVDVTGTGGADTLVGTSGIDRLYGLDGDDALYGNGDADQLEGGAGDDLLDGGAGSDLLLGGAGNDAYRFAAGHGADRLSDADGASTLAFGVAAQGLAAQVAWSGSTADLILADGAADSVAMQDGFAGVGALSLSFQDGAAQSFAAWLASRQAAGYVLQHSGSGGADTISGSAGADSISAGSGNDRIDAGGGNDTVYAGTGDDVIDGGAGGDTLSGDAGNDIYLFGRGNGSDTVVESSTSGASIVRLKAGTGLADLVIQKQGKNLQFAIDGSTDQLVVQGYASGKTTLSVGLQLVDGTLVSSSQLAGQALRLGTSGADTIRGGTGADRMYGLAGNDALLGKAGDDWLNGGAGNDSLQGAAGADLYLFAAGWGQDTVSETGTDGAIDTIMFGGGVSLDSLAFAQSGSDLVVSAADGSRLTIDNWYLGGSYRVEQLEDADGHVLMASQVDQLVQTMATASTASKAFVGGPMLSAASVSAPPGMLAVGLSSLWHPGDAGLVQRPIETPMR